jgi:hypothetical protein
MELVRQKNAATVVVFPIIDAGGDPVSGALDLSSKIGAFADDAAPESLAACTNQAAEIGSTGLYALALTTGEMNADYLVVRTTSSTPGAKVQVILVRTTVGDPLVPVVDASALLDAVVSGPDKTVGQILKSLLGGL